MSNCNLQVLSKFSNYTTAVFQWILMVVHYLLLSDRCMIAKIRIPPSLFTPSCSHSFQPLLRGCKSSKNWINQISHDAQSNFKCVKMNMLVPNDHLTHNFLLPTGQVIKIVQNSGLVYSSDWSQCFSVFIYKLAFNWHRRLKVL